MMRTMREGAFAGVLKYVLFTFLLMAVLGLVLMDISGAFSGNVSGNRDVAIIEGHNITIQDFDNTQRRVLAQMGISPQQAYQIGYTNEILANEIRGYLAMIEAQKLGVNIDNEQVKKSIAAAIKPLLQEGQTLQDAFEGALRERNMTERQFVAGIRKELTGDFVSETVKQAFFGSSKMLARDILLFQSQTRDVDVLLFPDTDIKEVTPPTEEQIASLYEAFKQTRFSIPETRQFKLGLYETSTDKPAPEVSAEDIKAYYQDNIENFAMSEQKLITQVLVQEENEATAIMNEVNTGKTLEQAFADVKGKDGRGLTPNMKLEMDVMFPDMRGALEQASIGQVVGPFKTPLGVHIVRLEGSVPSMTRPLAEVSENIKAQLAEQSKMDEINTIVTALEDHFMNGGTLADMGDITKLKISELPSIEVSGLTKEGKDIFESQPEDIKTLKNDILKEGFAILSDDMDKSRIIDLPDGRFVVLELAHITPESFKPLEEVRQDIIEQYQKDFRSSENANRVRGFIDALNAGEKTLASLAQQNGKQIISLNGISVSGALPAPLNDEIRPSIFKEPIETYLSFEPESSAGIIYLRSFKIPALTPEQESQLDGVHVKLDEEMKTEALLFYLDALSKKYPAKINETLLKRAYAQAPSDQAAP